MKLCTLQVTDEISELLEQASQATGKPPHVILEDVLDRIVDRERLNGELRRLAASGRNKNSRP